jgi:hypothetical protein
MYSKQYYQQIETELRQLVSWLWSHIPAESLVTIEEYLDVGEYGLALDDIIQIVDHIKINSEKINVVIRKLKYQMGI